MLDKCSSARITPRFAQFVERAVASLLGCEVIFSLGHACEGVDFIEYKQQRFLGAVAYLAEGLFDNLNLLLEVRMGDVDHVDENIGLAYFVEGGLE